MATAILTNDDPALDTRAAADYLGLRPSTLEIWRSTGRYSLPFEKHGRIQPEWLGRLWSIWEKDSRLAFTTPSRYFALHPPAETLRLLPGGGFERNDLEHSATFCEPLRRQLRKLAAQVDLLQEKVRRAAAAGHQVQGIRRKIEGLSEQMLALEVSDLCRWHPGASKRAQGIAKARRALARGRLLEQEIDRLAG